VESEEFGGEEEEPNVYGEEDGKKTDGDDSNGNDGVSDGVCDGDCDCDGDCGEKDERI
jgi:hypothetical protein